MSTFEDRLWSELVREHGDQMRLHGTTTVRRLRPVVVGGTALITAGVTAAAVLALTATTAAPPAFAVTTHADGTVTVTLNDTDDGEGVDDADGAGHGIVSVLLAKLYSSIVCDGSAVTVRLAPGVQAGATNRWRADDFGPTEPSVCAWGVLPAPARSTSTGPAAVRPRLPITAT
jgi:hypothetical protein